MWIYNIKTGENKKVPKDFILPEDWIRGRKIK